MSWEIVKDENGCFIRDDDRNLIADVADATQAPKLAAAPELYWVAQEAWKLAVAIRTGRPVVVTDGVFERIGEAIDKAKCTPAYLFRTTLEDWAANNCDGAPDADKGSPANVIATCGIDDAIERLDVSDLEDALEVYADDAEVFPALAWLLGRLMR